LRRNKIAPDYRTIDQGGQTMTIGFDEIQLEETHGESIARLTVKQKLDKADYEAFVPQLEWLIEKKGKINLLIELVDFKGWTVGALWEDTRFAVKHFADINKMAVVGEGKSWEKAMTAFAKPFTRAKVRYFEFKDKESAEKWLAA
jgi:hypothetical protein